jgi:hypothetical protein
MSIDYYLMPAVFRNITNLVCYTHFHWFFNPECQHIFGKQTGYTVGKQTHDLTVIASDSKTTQSGGDNRKKFPLGATLQVPQNFSFAPL